ELLEGGLFAVVADQQRNRPCRLTQKLNRRLWQDGPTYPRPNIKGALRLDEGRCRSRAKTGKDTRARLTRDILADRDAEELSIWDRVEVPGHEVSRLSLNRGARDQPPREWRRHDRQRVVGPRGASKERDARRVATESSDVVVDPVQGCELVENSVF